MNILSTLDIDKQKFAAVRAHMAKRFGKLSIVSTMRVLVLEKYEEITATQQ